MGTEPLCLYLGVMCLIAHVPGLKVRARITIKWFISSLLPIKLLSIVADELSIQDFFPVTIAALDHPKMFAMEGREIIY